MRNPRTIIAVFIAALALGGVVSSSASATTAGWMVGGTSLKSSAALASTAAVVEPAKLEADGVGVECGIIVTHTEGEIHISISSPSLYTLVLVTWLTCSVTFTESCSLRSPTIKTVPLGAEATLEGVLADHLTFSPMTKTTLATIGFEGEKCALAGVQPLTGKIGAKLPTGQDERTLQELAADISSGELKVGSSAATLKGAVDLKLASGQAWSFL